jgi:DNA-binding transcriptional LysR family regulator
MSLSSLQLDAFHEVAKTKSFSAAAENLNVTQSALSQRVLNLEEDLGASLFVREPKGIRLTSQGQRLLMYCEARASLESEARSQIETGRTEMTGTIRIAGFSSIMKSLVLPAVAEFIHRNPQVLFDLQTRELHELPDMLRSGRADFVFTAQPLQSPSVKSHLIGFEQNVLVKRKRSPVVENVFVDHDERDETTVQFFKAQKASLQPKEWKRSYSGDIETLIAAVKAGVGLAVIPVHLAQLENEIEIMKGYKAVESAVYLSEHEQILTTKLHTAVSELLRTKIAKQISK